MAVKGGGVSMSVLARERVKKRHKRLNRSFGGSLFLLLFLAFFGFFMLLPMVYSISQSLKPLNEIFMFPPTFLVRNPTFQNYPELIRLMSSSLVPFSRYIFNTVFISLVGTVGHVLIASMCAFSLSKLKVPGSRFFFNMVVLGLMFSGSVTAIPSFLIMRQLNWINNYASLIVPAFASPLGLYLMKQFMEQMIPDSVLESARMDGASEYRIFFRIVMPIVRPAWLTLIIFSFQGLWAMGASTYIFDEKLKTFNYAMSQILAGGIARSGAGAAAAVLMMIVPVAVFIFSQSSVVETMATSGIKE